MLSGFQSVGSAVGADWSRTCPRPSGTSASGALAHIHTAGGFLVGDGAPEIGIMGSVVDDAATSNVGFVADATQAAHTFQVAI